MKQRPRFLTSVTLIALAGCVDVDDPVDTEEDAPGEVTPLTGDSTRPGFYGVFEVGNTWHKDSFTVCWLPEIFDSTDPTVVELRAHGEAVVLREWGRVGRVRFNAPWPRCEPGSTHDIRIGNNALGGAGWSKIGTDALLVPAGQQTMGFSFTTREPCLGGVGGECNQTPEGLSDADLARFEHTALHEFGHALGLRHEHAHEASTCSWEEALDPFPYDGESIFTYDATSVMNYCSGANKLSNGDIRALHTLYPGAVGLYNDADFRQGFGGMNQPGFFGPGYYSGGLTAISSIVVPPGYIVRICTTSACTITGTTRALPAPYNDGIQNMLITPVVLGSDLFGYQGLTEAFTQTRNAPFSVLADNQLSSVLPAPTLAARVCTEPNGGGTCSQPFVGGGPPDGFRLTPGTWYSASYIEVSSRVVTYSGVFTGTSSALGLGVYTASGNAPFLPGVRALAIPGLEVRACTEEGLYGQGGGTCATFTQSVTLSSSFRPRYLRIRRPLVIVE